MQSSLLKRYLPRSLTSRAFLILALPVVILQIVVSVVFFQRHVEDVTGQMTANLLVEMTYLLEQIDAAENLESARLIARDLGPKLGIRVSIPASGMMSDETRWYDLAGGAVISALHDDLPKAVAVDAARSKSRVYIRVETKFGTVDLRVSRSRVSAANPHQLLVLMLTTGFLMTAISFLFLRNQLRPVTRLAAAADAFGKGRHLAYKPSGAAEVRSAGQAFLDMRQRIERQIEQRTLMLSGVSHDLRTPLTRMTLALSMMPEDDDTRGLTDDVEEMKRLVNEFLAFARGDAVEDTELVDARALVVQLVTQAQKSGQPVEISHCEDTGEIELRPVAIRRAVDNLIGNAVRYGTRAWVSVDVLPRGIRLRVEDDGPGIPEHQRSQAVQAFVRLDPSRNQNVSGVGLGLSIAADIAQTHGGQLRLGRSALHGGLRADLIIAK